MLDLSHSTSIYLFSFNCNIQISYIFKGHRNVATDNLIAPNNEPKMQHK